MAFSIKRLHVFTADSTFPFDCAKWDELVFEVVQLCELSELSRIEWNIVADEFHIWQIDVSGSRSLLWHFSMPVYPLRNSWTDSMLSADSLVLAE